MYSDFLNLNELNILHTTPKDSFPVPYRTFGGYDPSERQMAAFLPDAFYMYMDEDSIHSTYPIRILKISPLQPKFAEELSHRDYLGALLNLGVDRSVVGDILVQENTAWFFCINKMTDFFLENLCRVRHTNILITKVNDPDEFPQPKLESMSGTCASVRLDALIALAFKTSRSSMVSFIENGHVFVNGKLITSNGYEPKEGDIISVRGKGRFIYDGVSHQTKKGRCSVHISRYI